MKLNKFILAVIFFAPCFVLADINVQIVRVRGKLMQTDYQFDYALNESLNIWNQVSPVPVVIKRVRSVPDRWPGEKLSASGRFYQWYKYGSRRGWYKRSDMTSFVDRPILQAGTGYPYFQGFAYICSVWTSKAHSVSMMARARWNGDDSKFLGATALAHEGLHVLGAQHVWLADGSCNNLMHTGALACSVYSVPPIVKLTYDNVRVCLNQKMKLLQKKTGKT